METNEQISNTDGALEQSHNVTSVLTSDITHSNKEAAGVVETHAEPLQLKRDLGFALSHDEIFTIRSFMERPHIIAFGNLAAAGNWPTVIYSGIFPGAFMNIPMIKDKTQGIWGVRLTLTFTVAINAQRFQQGRYVLAWVPIAGATTTSDIHLVSHRASRTQLTQLPHVEIDINCETEASLTIPNISCFYHTPIVYSNTAIPYQAGQLVFTPYSAIKAGPSTYNCDYVITVKASDIEFNGPIQPQMSGRGNRLVKRRVNVTEQEQKSAGVGPVTSTLRVATSVAEALSTVPLLSSIAAPVSWATEAAANIAHAFGWSKPHQSNLNSLMQKNNFGGMTNTDTVDNSEILGYSDKNKIEVLPGFAGTDLDELSIRYLTSISSFYGLVTWSATDPENTLLASRDVHPKNFFSQSVYGTHTTFNLTPVAFVANFFALYRGSIKLTLKIVKTEFHSGRLMLTFMPSDMNLSTGTATTFANSAYNFREIIDIREGSVYHFVLPYMSFNQYRDTIGSMCSYGTFQLRVLNELRAPDTCNQSVDILLEVSGHEDLEFAQPSTCRGFPTLVISPQAGDKEVDMDPDPCAEEAVVMGNANIKLTDAPSRVCIGERILSLRQVLKKFSFIQKRISTVPGASTPYYTVVPWMMPVSQIGVSNIRANSSSYPDNLTWIASCFALFRGGVRLKYATEASMSDRFFQTSSYKATADSTSLSDLTTVGLTPPGIFDINQTSNLTYSLDRVDSRGGIEVELPYYNRTFASPVYNALTVSTLLDYNTAAPLPQTRVYTVGFGPALTTEYRVYRAVSDDFELGQFISVLPILEWGFTGGA